ncbi:hypothetical protein SG0102_12690 [Intestinibaculum porci]|uniref:Uncharacterized protein n=1 Tax=Intestinibaculum porci TaxID=2487118 RepID=A0A3G9JD44_9FIRM|nr:hypothetical protein [Intestinibaculum porci]BBH26335.1 hypothetical protein SG0102_12690 [Intestinibaculum porci]HAN57875.1 hypothetical protein [Erysipelotrichaceae bacterium]
MKHKVKAKVKVEKRGLFGKKYVYETRTIWVDDRTYRKLKRQGKYEPITIDDMMIMDAIFDD